MKILLDTNIFIPLEPTSASEVADNTPLALNLFKLVQKARSQVFIHPHIFVDIGRDSNNERRRLRELLASRYPSIPSPPPPDILDPNLVGKPPTDSNDYVDNCLLATIKANACELLVTEDLGVHQKAIRLGIEDRVLLLQQAVDLLATLFDQVPVTPPAISAVYAHQIELTDPILDSLRTDYDGFDNWFRNCQKEHRQGYVIRRDDGTRIAAVAILKPEDGIPGVAKGKTLKICTFKVAPEYSGRKYGELLLRAAYDYAVQNKYVYTYFTVYPNQKPLMTFAQSFGFFDAQITNARNERFFVKDLDRSKIAIGSISAWDYHLRLGPGVTSFSNNSTFIVPIRPTYHQRLFPELSTQRHLFKPEPCGNGIKKAYLCHSHINALTRGDNLLFYRSEDLSAVTSIGVVEDTLRSQNVPAIATHVGARTVYTYADIEAMSASPILAIRFRHVGGISRAIGLEELLSNRVLKGPPQSITQVDMKGTEWLETRIER